jgi:hypothetical protein
MTFDEVIVFNKKRLVGAMIIKLGANLYRENTIKPLSKLTKFNPNGYSETVHK